MNGSVSAVASLTSTDKSCQGSAHRGQFDGSAHRGQRKWEFGLERAEAVLRSI